MIEALCTLVYLFFFIKFGVPFLLLFIYTYLSLRIKEKDSHMIEMSLIHSLHLFTSFFFFFLSLTVYE